MKTDFPKRVTQSDKSDAKCVMFDLDGTLTDPGEGITDSVMYALGKWDIRVADRKELYKFIGPPLKDSFRDFYGFTDEQCDRAIAYYREFFSETGIFENEVYPGIEEMLGELKAEGFILAVATTKPYDFAVKILKHFGLYGYFDFVSGATMDGSRSRKSDIIGFALENLRVAPVDTVMIGDRKHDIIGAAENGTHSVGVLYGYGSREEFEESGADMIVSDVGELTNAVRKLLRLI